jgi:hypothetical protein
MQSRQCYRENKEKKELTETEPLRPRLAKVQPPARRGVSWISRTGCTVQWERKGRRELDCRSPKIGALCFGFQGCGMPDVKNGTPLATRNSVYPETLWSVDRSGVG